MTAAQTMTGTMRLLDKILARFRAARAAPPGGYGPEVLFAGWVELPEAFRQLAARRSPGSPRSRTIPA